jgi:hypothetical protein
MKYFITKIENIQTKDYEEDEIKLTIKVWKDYGEDMDDLHKFKIGYCRVIQDTLKVGKVKL